MITTIRNLPISGGLSRAAGQSTARSASRSTTPMDPLHDECSGLANLREYHREEQRRVDQRALMLALGMVIGGLIVWIMVVTVL